MRQKKSGRGNKMYEISVESHFDAAHFLREYHGKCENLHGHRYTVIVSIRSDRLDKGDMAYDFTELKRLLNEILKKWDHRCLNDVEPFDKINPSAENIASQIYSELRPMLPEDITLHAVQVWETPQNRVTFYPG